MYDIGFEEELMNIRDSVRGVITGQNKDGGLYIDMQIEDEESEDGIITVPVFGYWSAKVNRGTEVICSIKSWAKENKRIAVRIDSVDYDSERAA
mgnify:FL=1